MMISLDMVLETLHTITKLGNYSFLSLLRIAC